MEREMVQFSSAITGDVSLQEHFLSVDRLICIVHCHLNVFSTNRLISDYNDILHLVVHYVLLQILETVLGPKLEFTVSQSSNDRETLHPFLSFKKLKIMNPSMRKPQR